MRAARKSPALVTALERQFNLRAWIERTQTVHDASPPEYTVFCPDCGRPKLVVNVELKAWHCFFAGCTFRPGWSPRNLVMPR